MTYVQRETIYRSLYYRRKKRRPSYKMISEF